MSEEVDGCQWLKGSRIRPSVLPWEQATAPRRRGLQSLISRWQSFENFMSSVNISRVPFIRFFPSPLFTVESLHLIKSTSCWFNNKRTTRAHVIKRDVRHVLRSLQSCPGANCNKWTQFVTLLMFSPFQEGRKGKKYKKIWERHQNMSRAERRACNYGRMKCCVDMPHHHHGHEIIVIIRKQSSCLPPLPPPPSSLSAYNENIFVPRFYPPETGKIRQRSS